MYNKCVNLLFLPERYHISILDGGADTWLLAKDGSYYQSSIQEERMQSV
jgi:hypothetical protein